MSAIDVLVIAWVACRPPWSARAAASSRQAVALIGLRHRRDHRLAARAGAAARAATARPGRPIAALIGAIVCGLLLQAAATPLANRMRAARAPRPAGAHRPRRRPDRRDRCSACSRSGCWPSRRSTSRRWGCATIVQRSALLPPIVDRPAGGRADGRAAAVRPAAGDRRRPRRLAAAARPPAPAATPGRHRRRQRRADRRHACSLELRGSGWVIRPQLVVTNAHVIAGEDDTAGAARPTAAGRRTRSTSTRISTSRCCACPGSTSPPLATHPLAADTAPVALIGYPGGGALTVAAGTAGRSVTVLAAGRVRPRPGAAHGGADPRDRCATATRAARWSTAGGACWP